MYYHLPPCFGPKFLENVVSRNISEIFISKRTKKNPEQLKQSSLCERCERCYSSLKSHFIKISSFLKLCPLIL